MSKKEKILFVLILFFLTTLFLPWLKLANILAAIFLGLYSFFFNSLGKSLLPSERKLVKLFPGKMAIIERKKILMVDVLFFYHDRDQCISVF
jgi:hypothetical protein